MESIDTAIYASGRVLTVKPLTFMESGDKAQSSNAKYFQRDGLNAPQKIGEAAPTKMGQSSAGHSPYIRALASARRHILRHMRPIGRNDLAADAFWFPSTV
ncbi:hypothetical protein [Mesorhizobium sp. WSM4884]|uniref:hypothetical protein n=1 Tax=Mesorhizobium sp. WSM4884 TaxID=3038542 RepID=UPI0024170A18|nr:hypothetical protein [Mesorhizobium sp. WSM4884]MDG4879762.1 hypothetical protein [Mesorhizobium sp. WSM4884]